jgi:large subunit ribosomal protein L7/L12
MATIDERITALEAKLEQEKAKKQKIEAMKVTALMKGNSSSDTRRKILAGSLVLKEMLTDDTFKVSFLARLNAHLKRADDRALFDLPPLAVDPIETTADTFLNVPIEQKDEAKHLGARWNAEVKKWFVPAGVDIDKFTKWLP